MTGREKTGRRQFTAGMALALLGGAAVSISCGGGGSSPSAPAPVPTPAPTPAADGKVGSVSDNHGHEARITGAELLGGNAVRIELRSTVPHTHTVELSAAELVRVRNGERVQKTTSNDVGLFGPHEHTVTFN